MAQRGGARDAAGMETTEKRALVRPKDNRWLGGVCEGLGLYFDLNPAVYRIAFAALAFAGGTGVVLYAASWLVIPEEGAPDSIAATELRKYRDHPNRLLGLALLAAVGLAVLSSIRLWPSPGNFWVLAALLIAAFAFWRGRFVVGIVAAVLVVAVAGLLFAVRVPVWSGVGERTYETLHSKYELGIGSLELDLRYEKLPKGQTFVRADLGIGRLKVIVPEDATVELRSRIQAGDIDELGLHQDGSRIDTRVTDRTGSGRVLVLDLRLGFGHVAVERR
jgi:phage shock protein PspC (stress-responsive transcriptional regulator)